VRREKIISAIDIGSTAVRAVCALVPEKGGNPRIVGVGEAPTLGVRKGQIVDIAEVSTALRAALADAERTSGFRILRPIAVVGGVHVSVLPSIGAVAVSRADAEVSPEDVTRVLESARAVSLPQNREIIQVLPLSYALDKESDIEDPVGMKGVRLEGSVFLVLASRPLLRAVEKCVGEAGRAVESWTFAPLATARAVLTKKQKEAGVALLTIGGAASAITVFKEGELVECLSVPLGGSHVTNDIAIGLRTQIDVAERVKIEYGSAFSPQVSRREQVMLSEWGLEEISISRYALSQMIESRMKDLFEAVRSELKKYLKGSFLPGGVVLAGGGAKLPGVVELARRELKLPVELGKVREVESDLPEGTDPAYAVLAGAVLLGYERDSSSKTQELISALETEGIVRRFREWFREFLP
jgi:cell division protein FtsA